MILFSLEKQAFYDSNLKYDDLPNDLIELSDDQHQRLYIELNKGARVLQDLTFSTPKPSQFHEWNGSEWVDPRTEEEKLAYKRSQYPSLTRYQCLRCLLENGFKASDIEAQILTIKDEFSRELTLLGYKEATNFVRMDERILAMQSVLNLTDERVDQMWEYASTL